VDRNPLRLRRLRAADLERRPASFSDPATSDRAAAIVAEVRERGEKALLEYARDLDGLGDGSLYLGPRDFRKALEGLPRDSRELLVRAGDRIGAFAKAQAASLSALEVPVPGGFAGHEILPVETAGCYAPGGRYPLPSSVLMTALTARAAGVSTVWAASPRPAPETLAACAVAGADGLLAAGGAQAIAALAYGAGPIPPCARVVGPGNRWVAAAKRLVAGDTVIESVAGPSELLVLTDDVADPEVVAADLLAQAEHDPDAVPVLACTTEAFAVRVEAALERRLWDLSTGAVARRALDNGGALVDPDLDTLARAADAFAPEHLEILTKDPESLARRIRNAGAVFLAAGAAEVLGDYGTGPNHVLPTGGHARLTGGLSALSFLRVRTWIRIDDPAAAAGLYRDASAFARLEGLEAHARAGEVRGRWSADGGR
jgi:phosphoribosyl-ATP pyrophosphohydrolase/phosphoribosyl-AMP cyclohydrolase/histidinol dehydrogenase